MKFHSIGALRNPVVPVPFVAPRWLTAVPPIEAIGDDRFTSHRESEDEDLLQRQMRSLRTMALQQQRERGEQPLPDARNFFARPDAAVTPQSSEQKPQLPRREESRPETPAHGFEGTDVSTLSDARFFAMTQSLKRTALAYQALQAPRPE